MFIMVFRNVSCCTNLFGQRTSSSPHCNGGVCRQLQFSTSDYTTSIGFPLSKRVAKISHEWWNPSTDWSDAAWIQFWIQNLKVVRFISLLPLLYESRNFIQLFVVKPILLRCRKNLALPSLLLSAPVQKTHTQFTFHFETHHIWLYKERPLLFFLQILFKSFLSCKSSLSRPTNTMIFKNTKKKSKIFFFFC